jgi:peptide/nickel transport system substrate-binding protein
MGASETPDAWFDEFLDHWSRRDFLRRMGGATALSLFLAGGGALLDACGGGAGGAGATKGVKKGGHVVEASLSDPSTFNVIFSHDTASSTQIGMMFAGLLDSRADGSLIPSIAKTVPKVDSDQVTYRFDLRTDVTWSDGRPLTADDVLFTYALMAGSTYDYRAINSRFWPDLELYLQSVTAPDPHTVIMKTKGPYAPFLTGYVFAPLPKHVLEPIVRQSPADFQKAAFNLAPTVSSGAFQFDHWDKSQQVVLKANPRYFLGRPNLDSYVTKTVPDAIGVTNLLKTGEADIGGIDPSLWDDMATASNVRRIRFPAAGYEYYGYNMDPTNPKRPVSGHIFGDPTTGRTVRQALYLAVNRRQLAQRVYFNEADAAYTVEPNTSWAATANVPKYDYNPKKAAAMLDQAGWKMGPDGVRTRDGVRFSFEIITNVGNKTRESAIQVLAEAWRQIGVQAVPRLIQFPQYVDTASTRDFDMVLGGIAAGVDPDLSQIYASRVIGKGLNRMGYRNQDLDNLLDEAVKTLDQGKRKQAYVRVQQTLMRDLPTGMLVWPRSHWGVSKRVQGFGVGPFNQYNARPWLKDVWVSDGR